MTLQEQYYKIDPNYGEGGSFKLTLALENATYEVFAASDTTTPLADLLSLSQDQDYIIKFVKSGDQTQVEASIEITLNI